MRLTLQHFHRPSSLHLVPFCQHTQCHIVCHVCVIMGLDLLRLDILGIIPPNILFIPSAAHALHSFSIQARQIISATLSIATTLYIAATHNITHSPCTQRFFFFLSRNVAILGRGKSKKKTNKMFGGGGILKLKNIPPSLPPRP